MTRINRNPKDKRPPTDRNNPTDEEFDPLGFSIRWKIFAFLAQI
jgi:hypothetical protein